MISKIQLEADVAENIKLGLFICSILHRPRKCFAVNLMVEGNVADQAWTLDHEARSFGLIKWKR